MRGNESVLVFNNETGITHTFELKGGVYVADVIATGSGSVDLKRLGPNGSTYLTAMTQITATGVSAALYLPPGQYEGVTAGLTAVYMNLTRVPFE